MSEAFLTRRGGSGGLSPNNAVIHVKAPVGSTVTFAKGGVTVKVLDASKGHANVDGESADYYLSVSSGNYGTWTVTATLGTETTSDTVTVDAAKQYDVTLSYFTYLYLLGDECLSLTGGYTYVRSNENSSWSLTENGDNLETGASYNSSRWTGIVTVNTIDLTPFSTLYIEYVARKSTYTPGKYSTYGYSDSNPHFFVGITASGSVGAGFNPNSNYTVRIDPADTSDSAVAVGDSVTALLDITGQTGHLRVMVWETGRAFRMFKLYLH